MTAQDKAKNKREEFEEWLRLNGSAVEMPLRVRWYRATIRAELQAASERAVDAMDGDGVKHITQIAAAQAINRWKP